MVLWDDNFAIGEQGAEGLPEGGGAMEEEEKEEEPSWWVVSGWWRVLQKLMGKACRRDGVIVFVINRVLFFWVDN